MAVAQYAKKFPTVPPSKMGIIKEKGSGSLSSNTNPSSPRTSSYDNSFMPSDWKFYLYTYKTKYYRSWILIRCKIKSTTCRLFDHRLWLFSPAVRLPTPRQDICECVCYLFLRTPQISKGVTYHLLLRVSSPFLYFIQSISQMLLVSKKKGLCLVPIDVEQNFVTHVQKKKKKRRWRN